ncbi:MAG: hypothetical protein ACLT98_11315 [Eggerthellaceae bacterium]
MRRGFALLRVTDDGRHDGGIDRRSTSEALDIAASAFSEDRRDNEFPALYYKNTPENVQTANTPCARKRADNAECPFASPERARGFNEHGLGLSSVARIVMAPADVSPFSTGTSGMRRPFPARKL